MCGFFAFTSESASEKFIIYEVDLKQKEVKFYLKDEKNRNFKSLGNLRESLKKHKIKLLFATNGGMYKQDNSPQGLLIQENKIVMNIDTLKGNGNFYLKPNGVFYISDANQPYICKTENYKSDRKIKYATQSGPMLIIDGKIHSEFKENSTNLNIRNGVGILPNKNLIFAMSKNEINFYDFANYFKNLGCKNALYLDGFVSRTYCPEENWIQTDGNFGVIIGITER